MRHGLLLINLGTPKNTSFFAVWKYLRLFLTDHRVIDLPVFFRYLLVYFFILPFRTKRSVQAYKTIWTQYGSPLLYHSQNLADRLQKEAGSNYEVALGMRYGKPSITSALNQLKYCESITILPLYPQYSSAATGSSIEEVMRIISSWNIIPSLTIIRDFFQHPAYLSAQAELIQKYRKKDEHLVFSYHGIPERQITNHTCHTVCIDDCPIITTKNQSCYKAQCHQSSLLLAKKLKLSKNQYSTGFQSRLGKTSWVKPYTDELLAKLASQGVKKVVIACPSFVADCLETLEEIKLRAQKYWIALGGEQLIVVPCLNDDPLWIKAIQEIIHPQDFSGIHS